MATRSKALFTGRVLANAAPGETIYTVPANETTLVKSLWINNVANSTVTVRIGASGLLVRVAVLGGVPAGEHKLDPIWWALQPGMIVAIEVTAGEARVHMSGAELEGVTD